MYSVKEIFGSIQGEGAKSGKTAVFCRFSGCNLWSGREEDRNSATCQFCDTDFVGTNGAGGGKFISADDLAQAIMECWQKNNFGGSHRYVILTGGEPLLQVDQNLIDALHKLKFEIAVETNGTISIPEGIDWVCVSPKIGSELRVFSGDEIKVVVPQMSITQTIEYLKRIEKMNFKNFFIQPMDGMNRAANTKVSLELVNQRPLWRLSLQTHKILGVQ